MAKRTLGLSSAYQSNFLGHTTSSYTNLDQISSEESRPSINFKISNKHQFFYYYLNFKILTKPSSRISTKIKLPKLNQASASQSRLNFIFKILTKPSAQSLNKNLTSWPNFSFHICTKPSSTSFSAPTSAISISLSWYLHTPGSHQWSLLNSSQWVSQLVSLVTMMPLIGF